MFHLLLSVIAFLILAGMALALVDGLLQGFAYVFYNVVHAIAEAVTLLACAIGRTVASVWRWHTDRFTWAYNAHQRGARALRATGHGLCFAWRWTWRGALFVGLPILMVLDHSYVAACAPLVLAAFLWTRHHFKDQRR